MDTPPPARPILVALGSEAHSLRLIHAGFRLAQERSAPWICVYVDTGQGAAADDAEQVQVWMQEAQRLGAEVRSVEAPTLAQGLAEVTRRTQAQALVMGRSRDHWPWARLGHSTADELQRRGLAAEIVILDDQLETSDQAVPGIRFRAMVGTFLVLAVCTGLAWLVPREGNLALVLPVYLLGAILIGHRWGSALGILASALSILLYNFLLETPRFRQAGQRWPNLLFFLLILLAAQLLIGLLRRLRDHAKEFRRRELHTASLYLLGRALARSLNPDALAAIAAEHVRRVFKARAWLLLPAGEGWLARPEGLDPSTLPTPQVLFRQLVLDERVGDPLEPLTVGDAICLSLMGTDQSEGVLWIQPEHGEPLPPRTWQLLKAFAVQIALALERLRWLEVAHQAQVESETERLRSTLLGAIGHDLRTPLAAIHGAAGSLLLPGQVPDATRRDLLTMIQDESQRLAHLLGNLLDLTRLESGALQVQKEWQPLEEVVGAALGRLERQQGTLPVRVQLEESPSLVPLDAALIEQVLVNLITNAQRHAPGLEIDLRAWEEPGWLQLEVADRGPGIPADFKDRVFDKFFRLPDAGEGGVGLGLAICRAIVVAHAGTIQVLDRPGGGACFRLALPLDGTPPVSPEALP